MSFPLYYYRAVVARVVDGDTAWLDLDLGLRTHVVASCRLSGINAPEMSTGTPGQTSKDWLTQRISTKLLWVRSAGLDKYGRPLVTLYEPEPLQFPAPSASVNQEMLTLGLAVPDGVIG